MGKLSLYWNRRGRMSNIYTEILPNIAVSKDQKEWLREEAEKQDRSMAGVIRNLINKAMKEESK